MGARSSRSRGPGLNKTDGHLLEYFRQNFSAGGGGTNVGEPAPISATGGVINDYTVGTDVYRAHIFTSSGEFEVSSLSNGLSNGNQLEYLVVAGGGGGGGQSAQSGGGGAGGFRTNLTGHPVKAADYTASVGTYTVVVGGGGAANSGPGVISSKGGDSDFHPAPVSYPSTKFVRAHGGGGGIGYPGGATPKAGQDGGSGGGAACSPTAYSGGSGNTTDPNHPQRQGYDGGDGTPAYGSPFAGGGGGGAGGEGAPDNPGDAPYPAADQRSGGGYGLQCLIAGPPSHPQPVGAPGPGSGAAGTGYFAGGGGGGGYSATGAPGGYGGGGDGAPFDGTNPPSVGQAGTESSGGGGGGGGHPAYLPGGHGGSGVVVVRYKIGSTQTAKATGGAISFYNNKTIHVFTSSGTFSVTDGPLSIEYLLLGGGGGGGDSQGGAGGGGGAGGFITGPETADDATNYTVTIGAGGMGASPPVSTDGIAGVDTTLSGTGISVTARGGGAGGRTDAPTTTPSDYASGGGAGANSSDGAAAGPGGGYGGGASSPSNDGFAAGGGGGAGGAGTAGATPNPPNAAVAGDGGLGRQIPATFRNPTSSLGYPGPTGPVPGTNPGGDQSGNFWVAGGGGGGVGEYQPAPQTDLVNGKGGGPGAPADGWAGAGNGGEAWSPFDTYPYIGTDGAVNSGSGGGGGGYPGTTPRQYFGAAGGSGLVLIAYPT